MLANFTTMVEDPGGLAKVTSTFAHEMVRRGHEVSLVYSDIQNGDFYFPMPESVKCYDLRFYHGKRINIPIPYIIKREWLRVFNNEKARTVNNDFAEAYLLEPLREALESIKPDIIVSFQPAASKLLLCDLGTKIPVVTMSHGDPADYFETYPKAELPALEKSVVNQVLLPSFASHITNYLPNAKTIVIGNALPQYEEPVDLERNKSHHKILFIARLSKGHKRPHLLIEAFAKLAKQYPNWQVELWGNKAGKAYYKELEFLIKKNNLENQVFLKGTTKQVEDVLASGDIFVLPSAYEGFGLSLGEAMSKGLPAIGYKSCTAVNELIIDGQTGFLVNDGVDPLAEYLEILMKDQDMRVAMGKKARLEMKKYEPKAIWDTWENLLDSICKKF